MTHPILEPRPTGPQRVTTRRGANHGLHLVLTILSMGLWAPVWLIVAMIGRRETTWVQRDEYAYTAQTGQYTWDPTFGWVLRR